MRDSRARRMTVPVALMLVLVLGACGQSRWAPAPGSVAYGPVRSEVDAIAAARLIAAAQEPITIVNVRHGVASDLYTGAMGSFHEDQAGVDEQQARLGRDAWRVDLKGIRTQRCDTSVPTTFVSDIEVVIDSEFGTELFGMETCT